VSADLSGTITPNTFFVVRLIPPKLLDNGPVAQQAGVLGGTYTRAPGQLTF